MMIVMLVMMMAMNYWRSNDKIKPPRLYCMNTVVQLKTLNHHRSVNKSNIDMRMRLKPL